MAQFPVRAEVYHVSSSLGNDANSGTLALPLQSISALNALTFSPGDTVLFKSGDVWTGMFWLKGSGTLEQPIVVDRYGSGSLPVIDGNGYQASVLIYNDEHIVLRNLDLTNQASHLDGAGNTKKLTGFGGETNDWGSGKNLRFGVKVVADVASLTHFRMDSLRIHDIFPSPTNAANIYKGYGIKFETRSTSTLSNGVDGCDLFASGPNESWPFVYTVATPETPNSGAQHTIQFNVTSLPENGASYRVVKTVANGNWTNGNAMALALGMNTISVSSVSFDRAVKLQLSSGEVEFDVLNVNGTPLSCANATGNASVHLISNVRVERCEIERTGHYGIWIKSLGLVGDDVNKNVGITIQDCQFLHTGGSGFVPNKSASVLVQGCTFDHSGSSLDARMWKRGSGTWPFDCLDVVIQENQFLNAHGPLDSYGAHIDYGNENVVLQYNFSYHNEGGFVEILGDNIRCGYRYNISVNDGYREDPEGEPWDKKGKIFWVGNYCGSNTVRCPSTETFIYNNTVFVNDTLFPEIYVWPEVGDVMIQNNLIVASSSGPQIPTLIRNEENTLNISHNLFSDSSRFDLDEDLLVGGLFSDPELLYQGEEGVSAPLLYRVQNSSPAVGAGLLISGSESEGDYLHHNGGRDFFGFPVSPFNPPNIGAYNGPVPYCAEGTFWEVLSGTCQGLPNDCPGDINLDGLISSADLLMMLGVFGAACN